MTDGLLAGRYRRLGALGRGAMGEVWRAHDDLLDRQVAIKQLRLDVTDAAALQRITREARVAARLQHPNIVAVHDLITIADVPYVVMELVDGESLADRVRRVGPLSPMVAAAMLRQLATALGVAHESGVVHRDIKPGNVLLGRHDAVKLADFGIARSQGDAALTETGHMIGTVAFMPPEIAHGAAATAASDIWSLGATVYASVEGRAPFAGSGTTASTLLRLVSEDVPPPTRAGALAPTIEAMLERDPNRRPSASEVLSLLDGAADSVESTTTRRRPVVVAPAVPDSATAPTPIVSRRKPMLLLLGAAATVLALAGAAAVIAASGGDPGSRATPMPTNVALPAPLTVERTVVQSSTATATVTASAPTSSVPVVTETAPVPAVSNEPVTDEYESVPNGAIVIYSSIAETDDNPVASARATTIRMRNRGITAYYFLTDGVTNMRTGYYVVYSDESSLPSDSRLKDLRRQSGVREAYAKCGGVTDC